MTPEQQQWLTWGAIQHRPHGAPRWDAPGTAKAIADHCGSWDLAVATEHVLSHARDPKARTPFAIKGPTPHNEPQRGARYPAKPADECRVHPGEWATSCRSCAADRLVGDPTPARPTAASTDHASHRERLRVVVAEATADHCSHHVPRHACLEHRTTTEGDHRD